MRDDRYSRSRRAKLRPVELSQVHHTERIIDVRAVIQHQTPAICTVQETAEVPHRQQLDPVVDVAVLIQPTHSKRSPSESFEVQVQKGSPDIRTFMIAETADKRLGADVDDGFATTESELQVYSGEAAERETLAGNGIVKACAGSTASGSIRRVQGHLPSISVKLSITGSNRTMPEQNPNSRSLRVKAARTPLPQQQSRVGDGARRTSEPRD